MLRKQTSGTATVAPRTVIRPATPPRLQGDPVQNHDRVTTTPQMINDQSPRLMAMARIQGTGEECRMIGTNCVDWAMVVPSDLVAGSKTLSVTA
jgi:hypothetical protein